MTLPRLNIIAIDPSLRSTGVFTVLDGKINSYVLNFKEDRMTVLGKYLKHFASEAKDFDLLIIEDYSFGSQSRSVTIQAEVGGVIRSAFSARGKKIIEVPIQTWKAATGIRGDKVSLTGKSDYLNQVAGKYKVMFKTTDEADAFLLYMAVRLASQHMAKEIGANIRAQLDNLKIKPENLC